MTALVHPPFGAAPPHLSEALGPARQRDESEEIWAFAIAQAVVEHVPRLTAPPIDGGAELSTTPPDDVAGDRAASAGTTASRTAAGDTAAQDTAAGKATAAPGGDAHRTRGSDVPAHLTADLSDGQLGRLTLRVARGPKGLSIVINVADSHVKALIMADQAMLMKSLKDCGLLVASVQIGCSAAAGTGLAPHQEGAREGADRARGGASLRQHNARVRAYKGPHEEEETDTEGVDFTA